MIITSFEPQWSYFPLILKSYSHFDNLCLDMLGGFSMLALAQEPFSFEINNEK